jgi:hypothetical protein
VKNAFPVSALCWAVMLFVALVAFGCFAAAADPVKEKAKAKAAAALALAVAADVDQKMAAKPVAAAKREKCGAACKCDACTCDEKFTRAAAKPDPYRQVLKAVQGGEERLVYVGYSVPASAKNAVALANFDGNTKGVFRCFLQNGSPTYEERDDLIPTKEVTRTKVVKVKQCNGNGTCTLVDQPVTETVRVPDEIPSQ